MMNEAYIKYLEEKKQGLAKEEPLIPMHNRWIGNKRIRGGACRDPWASLEEQMSDSEKRAAQEISIGHRLTTDGLNRYAKMSFSGGAIRPGKSRRFGAIAYLNKSHEFEDNVFHQDLLERYQNWRHYMAPKMPLVLDACINIFGQGMNFTQASRQSHGLMSDKTVKKYCFQGLREYVLINKLEDK